MPDRKDFFESFAEEWDKNFTAEDLEILSDLIKTFDIKNGGWVIDIGCGTGVLFDPIRRRVGGKGMVVGVDFSSGMVHRARRNFPFPNCQVIDADASSLPFKSESFDLAISFASFAHFAEPEKVLDEVSRVLKPGGSYHIIHLLSSKELEYHHHIAGGPVAMDHLPHQDVMMGYFDHSHFINVKIIDRPGLYLATGVKG